MFALSALLVFCFVVACFASGALLIFCALWVLLIRVKNAVVQEFRILRAAWKMFAEWREGLVQLELESLEEAPKKHC